MNHSFDIEHARLYGLPEAIILQNVLFWLAHNKAFNRNMRDGMPWTFNSVKAYAQLFPYFTPDKIRRYFESLEKQKVLIAGNFNKKKYDKTKWHTVKDQNLIPVYGNPLANSPMADSPNGNGENAEPIPDVNTDEKQKSFAMLPTLKDSRTKNKKAPIPKELWDKVKPIYEVLQDITKDKDIVSAYKSLAMCERISAAIDASGVQAVSDAVRGRAMVRRGQEMALRWLFEGETDFAVALATYRKNNGNVIDMRSRFEVPQRVLGADELAGLDTMLSKI